MAGGESRRMGRDKVTLVVAGEPLWRRQVRTLREAGFEQIVIARGAHEPLGAGEPGLVEVPDAVPGCGPLGGLAAALPRVSTRWLLVLAVDLPLMPASFLREMIATTDADGRGRGLVPTIDGQHEPLAAIYPTAPASEFAAEALRTGALSLRDLVKKLVALDLMRELEVPAASRDFFRNVNTPEDLANIEQRIGPESDCLIV
jgi:molybdopterin-guanine dinucleotide biosynthesis protein A